MYEFHVIFKLKSKSKYSFNGVIECEDIKLRTENGKIHGEVFILLEKADINLAREIAIEKIEKLTSLLTLILKEGFIIEDIDVILTPIPSTINKEAFHDYIQIKLKAEAFVEVHKEFSKEKLNKIETELRKLSNKISQLERGKDLLRAIKWWRRGYFEEDGVDKFLDYYIVFEMLASIMGYKECEKSEDKCKTECNWAKRFAEDYSITYKVGDVNLAYIRNIIS